MKLSKATPGGAAGFYWNDAGEVHDVPDELAGDLLRIGHAGFSEVTDDSAPPVEEKPKSKSKPPVKQEAPTGTLQEAVAVAQGD